MLESCLLGPRQLSDLLSFARDLAPDGPPAVAPALLADRWRAAARLYRELERSEAGCADAAEVLPLTGPQRRHVDRLIEVPAVRQTFDTVPVCFGWLPLDRLVVSQYSITRPNVDRMLAGLPRRPGKLALTRLCLPLEPQHPDLRLVSRSEREFVFVSPSHDVRFLGAVPLVPAQAGELPLPGHVGGLIGLGVGHSPNLLNVVRFGKRFVINNGHHRAFALQALGATHAPCLIQVCENGEELDEAACSEICRNADLYFESPRPPLLRDYLRPELTIDLPVRQQLRELVIRVEVQRRLLNTW
ncbi:hypothetical protein [Sphaerotilus microaerophilus]|uniref:Uncharacterized protein n=1 Tax=Sphaerotilus microaerophilus TaxID=2914710 RepID=A0ABM7YTQ8_9BURK|nr:hypothetical protein [Sphaerotilus sp. FB-5]BDI08051.1 hypothetical protein CATMQ487_50210 [Sphaerotilus sp. FB-5]